jgi:DNA polymerase-3 subunit delta
MFYLLHGEDEYRRSLELQKMKSKLGDEDALALNTTELSGSDLTLDQLIFACSSLPFLADKRLVIVHGLAARLERRRDESEEDSPSDPVFAERLEEYLSTLPETARLVFVEDRRIKPANPILRMVSQFEHGYEKHFAPLRENRLTSWIAKRAREKGANIEREAVQLLAAHVGSDLRLQDQEIDKLLTYLAGERPITSDDVRLLVSYVREDSIFDLVDALGLRDTGKAMQLTDKMLEDGQHPLYILHMITRQFRILLQIRDLQARGTATADMATLLRLKPYPLRKALAQAPNFTIDQLEDILHRLLEIDAAVKSGEMEERLALELFVTEVNRQPAG